MRRKIFIEKLFQVCKAMQSVSSITKCSRLLLQSVSGIKKFFKYYKKCDRLLSQSVSGITKSDRYRKVRNNNSRIFLMKILTYKTFVKIRFLYGDKGYDGSRLIKEWYQY